MLLLFNVAFYVGRPRVSAAARHPDSALYFDQQRKVTKTKISGVLAAHWLCEHELRKHFRQLARAALQSKITFCAVHADDIASVAYPVQIL